MLARLWKLVAITLEQQHLVEFLWLSDGVCTCGNPIKKMSPKMCLAQINTSWCKLESVRNTMAVGIYCGRCAELIDVCLKSLKKLPEADKLKRTIISTDL
jgi:bacterioferritin-associated ferredoxin